MWRLNSLQDTLASSRPLNTGLWIREHDWYCSDEDWSCTVRSRCRHRWHQEQHQRNVPVGPIKNPDKIPFYQAKAPTAVLSVNDQLLIMYDASGYAAAVHNSDIHPITKVREWHSSKVRKQIIVCLAVIFSMILRLKPPCTSSFSKSYSSFQLHFIVSISHVHHNPAVLLSSLFLALEVFQIRIIFAVIPCLGAIISWLCLPAPSLWE